MGEINTSEEIVSKNVLALNNRAQITKTEDMVKSDAKSLSKHNKQYDRLLKAYVKDFELNCLQKRENKQKVFKIGKVLLILVPIVVMIFMFCTLWCITYKKVNGLDCIPGLLTAVTALISTFMTVPKMITKYLFNKHEEDHLTEIISKIQEYDINIREGL